MVSISEYTNLHLGPVIFLLLAIFATFFELSKIKINPWSWLFGIVGRLMNKEIIQDISELKDDIKKVKNDIDMGHARQARSNILRFGDELRLHQKHSKDLFDSILVDIDEYEKYCLENPMFKNSMTIETIEIIKDAYKDCLKENKFL